MDWHQPWLLSLDADECEQLHNECRTREKLHRREQRWGLSRAWAGLAHELLERMRELESDDDEWPDQLRIDVTAPGAYDHDDVLPRGYSRGGSAL